MHMVIRTIVYAENETEALDNARTVFEKLIENQDPFDYYQMFDEPSPYKTSGSGRWGNLTGVALVTSKEGKEFIKDGMKYTKESFMEHIKAIRKVLKKTNEELFKDKYNFEFRYPCYCIGEYGGSNIWLYDKDGEGIRTEKHLENASSNWGRKMDKDLKVYVIPADAHL